MTASFFFCLSYEAGYAYSPMPVRKYTYTNALLTPWLVSGGAVTLVRALVANMVRYPIAAS
jgi:hypothetical protein